MSVNRKVTSPVGGSVTAGPGGCLVHSRVEHYVTCRASVLTFGPGARGQA